MINFNLTGYQALWRDYREVFSHYSSAGPTPAAVGGLIGAAIGFNNRTLGPKVKTQGPLRPLAPDYIQWLKANNPLIAIGIAKTNPIRRRDWNVNGLKGAGALNEHFQILQKVLVRPSYKILLQNLNSKEEQKVVNALKNPKYPIYLGATHYPGFIREVNSTFEESDYLWLQPTLDSTQPESYPLSQHVTTEGSLNRILSTQYLCLPTETSSCPCFIPIQAP